MGDRAAEALAQCPRLTGLEQLNLGWCQQLGDRGALALASSPYLGRLTSLNLWGPRFGPGAVGALRQRFGKRVQGT